ncbi:unnamed protein product [Medioppia subpectinata]|uniref:Uncharacterized protein n=1 Tax=Medioppia subpectinata TaxID=1979941 RepID=A0A7R9KPB3_9ACAR|nr:unnamed protein product [Medioppia subpectinata]CAG2106985.1 unnamed protein product [Medioppia subpectinata]
MITCAPLTKEELCSVSLVPNQLIAKRFEESPITVRCEATLDPKLTAESSEFSNPVFDLSFGGAPRTGVFILRGNASCDGSRHRCWSEYTVSANSIGHLIQHSGHVTYLCQVADQLRNSIDRTQVRCQSSGSLTFTNVVKYGERCGTGSGGQECERHMECGSPETENESENERQCVCKDGFVSIPETHRKTICLEEVSLGSTCNYTKQCSAIDTNAICGDNSNGVKVCKCSEHFYEHSDYQSDYIKKCRIKSKPTVRHSVEDESTSILTIGSVIDPKSDKQNEDLKEDSIELSGNFTTNPKKNESTGSIGIILFFVAILLAITIVVIIIRVRSRSDKMVINKKRKTTEQQTDDNDGEQREPILATDDSKIGVDEVDDETNSRSDDRNDEQINNKINSINNNDSQKVQTPV